LLGRVRTRGAGDRPSGGVRARRRGVHRKRLRMARSGQAPGGCHFAARPAARPGSGAGGGHLLRPRQSGHRPVAARARSEDCCVSEATPSRALWSRLTADRLTLLALVLLVGIVLVALSAPLLPLADPNQTRLTSRLMPPLSEGHFLGTDQLGRDLLSRLV